MVEAETEVAPPVSSTWFVSPVCAVVCSEAGMLGGGTKTDWAFAPAATTNAHKAASESVAVSFSNPLRSFFRVFSFIDSGSIS
jgi:hypothetical protein